MDCNEARALLDADVDRELSAPDALRVQQHVEGCEACRRERARIVTLVQAVRQADYHRAPDALRASILASLPAAADAPVREQARALTLRVVLVIRGELAAQAEMREQLFGMTRVLGGDEVGAGEHRECTKRDVGEIADRRGHEIEAGRQRPRDQIGEHFARADHGQAGRLLDSLFVLLMLHGRPQR